MYRLIIIPEEVALKIKNTQFEGCEFLEPVKGEFDGKEVYFLQEEVKKRKVFERLLSAFEVCEIKEIEDVDISTSKTILTIKK